MPKPKRQPAEDPVDVELELELRATITVEMPRAKAEQLVAKVRATRGDPHLADLDERSGRSCCVTPAGGSDKMSVDQIRRYYGVDVKRGQRITVDGRTGRVTSFRGMYLMVRFDGRKFSLPCHPMWRVDYAPAGST